MTTRNNITSALLSKDEQEKFLQQVFIGHEDHNITESIISKAYDLSADYNAGTPWNLYELSHGGFYMAPAEGRFNVKVQFSEGDMAADAFGICCCLYTFNHIAWACDDSFGNVCIRLYKILYDFLEGHPESSAIRSALD